MTERSKKVYVGAGFEDKKEAQEWMLILRDCGFEITSLWTRHEPITPYNINSDKAAEYSMEDLGGVAVCDIFILKCDMARSGAHAEFGAAIALGKNVFVVGENREDKMFYFHPDVHRVETFEELLEILDNIQR